MVALYSDLVVVNLYYRFVADSRVEFTTFKRARAFGSLFIFGNYQKVPRARFGRRFDLFRIISDAGLGNFFFVD